MEEINRKINARIKHILELGKSVLLLGPRQTGKTTILRNLPSTLQLNFADPRIRLRYEKNPGLLIDEVSAIKSKSRPLVTIDEVQKVPAIMDAAQYVIDNKLAQLVLTGSSARKLKRNGDTNLLPGRVIALRLDALMIDEIPKIKLDINQLILYGMLPEILLMTDQSLKEDILQSYVITYLEEEVRMESLVRNLANFASFLELAASEAGRIVNMTKLSQVIGVATTTIQSYFQILEDCLIVERIEPITYSKKRHRLAKAQRYLFYDVGVRRVAAREGLRYPKDYAGHLFEQFIGMELIKQSRLEKNRTRLRYWKDQNGPEVDWVLEQNERFLPIEVKWTDAPSINDAKHLKLFLDEYPTVGLAYIVCNTPNPLQLADNIIAINWKNLSECFQTFQE